MSLHPDVLWTERQDKVYLIVMFADAKNVKVNLHPDNILTFSRSAGADNKNYELKLELFAEVVVEESVNIGVKRIFCTLMKVEKKWWNKLLCGNTPHSVKFDWDKWLERGDDEVGRIFAQMEKEKAGEYSTEKLDLGADSENKGHGSGSMGGGKEHEYNPSDQPDTIDSDDGFDTEDFDFEGFGLVGEDITETLDLGADYGNMGSGCGNMGGGKEQEYNPSDRSDTMDFDIESFDSLGLGILGEDITETLNLGADYGIMGSGCGNMGGGKEKEYNSSDWSDTMDFDIESFESLGLGTLGEDITETLDLGADYGNMGSGCGNMGGGKEQEYNPSDRSDTMDFDIESFDSLGLGKLGEDITETLDLGADYGIMCGGKEQEYKPSNRPDSKEFDIESFDSLGLGILGEFIPETFDLGADSRNMGSGSGSMGDGKDQEFNPSDQPDTIDSGDVLTLGVSTLRVSACWEDLFSI